jgi:hypothetical protein
MKNAILWEVAPCGSCWNICYGGTLRRQLLVTASVVSSSLTLSIMKMEAVSFPETSVLT